MFGFANRIRVKRYGRASIHRKFQNRYLAEYFQNLRPKTVLNLGATPGAPDKEGRTYEAYFPEASFRTLDLGPSDHPQHIQADLMDLPIGIGEFDLVMAMSIIEHIDRPWLAAPNITKLIRPGGHLYIAMPWFYPVHEGPYFGDHWRATPSAMGFLFDTLEVVRFDYYPSPLRVVRDRKRYWNNANSTAAGFSMLMQRPGA